MVAPDARTLAVRTPHGVQSALRALSGSRFFAGLGERALLGDLRQVRDYLHEPDIRQAGPQRVRGGGRAGTRVLVGHSLGSVVAYEALCANPEWPVTMLVTLGSPLGIPNLIFDRLQPAPAGGSGGRDRGAGGRAGRAWTNVADQGDVVALVKDLRGGCSGRGWMLGGGQRRERSRCQAVSDRGGDRASHYQGPGRYADTRRAGGGR